MEIKKPKAELTTTIKKLRKRVKKLESELQIVNDSSARLEDEVAKQGRMLDKMGLALRECIKVLKIDLSNVGTKR